MKIKYMIAGLVTGATMLLPQAIAETFPASGAAKPGLSAQIKRMPAYKPPRRGAPSTRVGGGTRGIEAGETPSLYALAPDHVGLTGSEQPTLSWYMSKPTTMRFEFLLIDEEGIEPLLEITLDSKELKAGIQGINLADYGVKLKPGEKYQWSVALVPDAKHRSSDITSGGMIERQDATNSVADRLAKASSQEDAFIYAEEGYWYDAVSELSDLIEKTPDNEILKQQRAVLLKQAGLPES